MRLTGSAFVLLLAMTFVVGCAPTKPGPISVVYTHTPSTVHAGDSVTVGVSVTNRGLDVQVSKIMVHDTCLSGDFAGQSFEDQLPVQVSTVPKKSTAVVFESTAEVDDHSVPTTWKILVTVYSDGGEASDEVIVTYLPRE
jgi:hypothetical protein